MIMKYMQLSRRSTWLVITLLLICGAALLYPSQVSGTTTDQDQSLITHVLRYHSSEAGEVALIWGVNGWQMLPAAQRPADTTIVKSTNDVMQTPMQRTNDAFEVTLQVPAGSTIDYLFHITRARSGVKAEAWDFNRLPEQDFHTLIVANGVTDVPPTISLGQELFGGPADAMSQWVAALILLGMTLLIGCLGLRLYMRNPYVDF
jgi:hypothetical protein